MERSEHFYITLDSKRIKFKSQQDENNADFKVSIPNGITLSSDKHWEVGLVDGIIPNKVFNITESNNTFFLAIRNAQYPETRIERGYQDVPFYNEYGYFDTNKNRKMNYNYRFNMFEHYKKTLNVDNLSNVEIAKRTDVLFGIKGPKDDSTRNIYYNNICTLLPFKIPTGVYNDYKILTGIMEDSWNKVFGNFLHLRNIIFGEHRIKIGTLVYIYLGNITIILIICIIRKYL